MRFARGLYYFVKLHKDVGRLRVMQLFFSPFKNGAALPMLPGNILKRPCKAGSCARIKVAFPGPTGKFNKGLAKPVPAQIIIIYY